jgi:hypothetical protein
MKGEEKPRSFMPIFTLSNTPTKFELNELEQTIEQWTDSTFDEIHSPVSVNICETIDEVVNGLSVHYTKSLFKTEFFSEAFKIEEDPVETPKQKESQQQYTEEEMKNFEKRRQVLKDYLGEDYEE